MILYCIQSTAALLIIISIYHLLLKKSRLFSFNRFYLLTGLFLSLLLPAFQFEVQSSQLEWIGSIQEVSQYTEQMAFSSETLEIGEKKSRSFPLSKVLIGLYCIGFILFAFRFFFNLYSLLSLTKNKGPQLNGMQSILITQESNPYSFFAYLFIQESQLEAIQENTSLLEHEKAHYLQKHSIDVLLVETLQCLFWFNLILILYKKAIKTNHEFLADEYASQEEDTQHYLEDLLQFAQPKTPQILGSGFGYLTIKKRIKMMHQSKPTIMNKTAKITACLLATVTTLAFTAFTPYQIDKEALNSISAEIKSDSKPSILPIKREQISKLSSHFGMRNHPVFNERRMHTGIDIIAPEGTPIIATADGTIEIAKYTAGYGKHIKIKHNNTYQSMYAHLESMNVHEGQEVKAGEVIGIIGSTGKSISTHLHYEVIKKGKKVDPATYFEYEINRN